MAGINRYISEARLDPTKMPGEYVAINRPLGPEPWRATDVIATASLVGAIFGKGGGDELTQMQLRSSFVERYGARRGPRLWREWAAFEDPDAPTTVHGRRFPYQTPPRQVPRDAAAIADAGSLRTTPIVAAGTGSQGAASRAAPGPGSRGASSRPAPPDFARGAIFPPGWRTQALSNALLVSARESAISRPLAVFGPQTSWQNRPTYQQAVEVRGHRPRP